MGLSRRLRVDPIAIAQRRAFEACRRGQYEEAEAVLREAERATGDRLVKGWLLEQVAAVVFHLDKERSQQVLAAANERNTVVTKPLAGIAYRRIDGAAVDQAVQAQAYLKQRYPKGGNSVVLGINGLLDDLVFGGDFDEFEQALMELGLHLGFQAQRPEKEGVWPLDVLWGIGNREYVLFSCKNEATSASIPKRYTDEVGGSVNWFGANYDGTCRPIAVIIHPSNVLDKLAGPPGGMRVVSVGELDRLRAACEKFATAIKDSLDDATHIRASLGANGLQGAQFGDRHTAMPN